jgi:cysteine desulfurase
LEGFAKCLSFIYHDQMKKIIYLDNAATTPVRKEVGEAMKPYWTEIFGNPSSITKMGIEACLVVEKSRAKISELISARSKEIFFTSGGTESNNLAILGVANNLEKSGLKISDLHFISSNIEHSSVAECFRELERRGAQVDYLSVKENGLIDSKDLRKMLKPNTVLVSIGYANNEIGTIQPVVDIAKEIRHARKFSSIHKTQDKKLECFPIFHTDASQAGLFLNLNINQLGVDLMTLDAQKIFGPKGVGMLFIRDGVKVSSLIFGGGQEKGLRAGTENVPLVVGLAKALEIARKDFEKKAQKIKVIRDYFWKKIIKEVPGVCLNGDLENRLANNLNVSIPGVDSEFTVLCLDEAGIVCSTKSACNQTDEGSYVVRALGKSEEVAKSTLRFSLASNITKKDINFAVSALKNIVQKQLKKNLI